MKLLFKHAWWHARALTHTGSALSFVFLWHTRTHARTRAHTHTHGEKWAGLTMLEKPLKDANIRLKKNKWTLVLDGVVSFATLSSANCKKNKTSTNNYYIKSFRMKNRLLFFRAKGNLKTKKICKHLNMSFYLHHRFMKIEEEKAGRLKKKAENLEMCAVYQWDRKAAFVSMVISRHWSIAEAVGGQEVCLTSW